MSNIQVSLQPKDRQTLIELIKGERRSLELSGAQIVNAAQKRGLNHYDSHLMSVHKRLDPKDGYWAKY